MTLSISALAFINFNFLEHGKAGRTRALACARTHARANTQAISIDQDIPLSLPKHDDKRIDDTLSVLPLAHNDGFPAAAERRWKNN